MSDPNSGQAASPGRFNLSAWALAHRSFTGYLIVACMIAGLFSYFRLGQKEDPEFTFRVMLVRALWPGATAREVEQQVTDKIEKKLQETPNLDFLRSYSRAGEATIFVNLKESTPPKDVAGIWYQVRKKVGDIRGSLPQEVLGPFFNDEFGDTFGSIYAFSADGFTYAELKMYVDSARQELLRLPNVAKVDLLGVQDEKIYIEYSNKKIAQLGIDPQLFVAIGQQQAAVEPAGTVATRTDNVQLRVTGDFQSVDSIKEMAIRANGNTFRLGDITTVYRGYIDPPSFKMRFQGKEAIGVAISMTRDGDVIELGESLSRAVARLRAQLPVGIEIEQVSDQPAVVQRSVNEFMRTLAEAVLIVLGVSFLSLGLRTGMVVALTIPLVLAITFLVMLVVGIDLQRISLGALIIALGLLVDDAMIAVEMMMRKLEEGLDRMRAATFAYETTAFPMLTGTLITAAGFLPIGTAKSAAGEYTFSIFAVTGIALVVSWFAAVLFTPYIGYLLLKTRAGGATGPGTHGEVFDTPFYRRFRRLVTWCLEQRRLVLAATLAVFAAAIVAFRFVEMQFFPSANRPELVVDMWLAEGSSFANTEGQAKKLERKLVGDPDVDNVTAYIGAGSPRFYLPLDQQLNNLNFAQFVIMAKGLEQRERLRERIKRLFETDFPEVRGRVARLENGPPVGYPVQFRVIGQDPERLRQIAQEVGAVMRSNPQVSGVNFDWNERIKVMRLEIDQDKARAIGVSSQSLSRSLRGNISGQTVGQYREGDKLLDIVAWAREEERNLLSSVQDLVTHTQNGRFVPMAQVARVKQEFEEPIVWRRNRFPAITVRADIADGVQAPDVTFQIDPLLQPLRSRLPDGYRIDIAGAQESSAVAQASIAAGIPLMVLIVFTLLMVQLHSVQRAVLVFLTAPLGLIGVVIALLALRVPFGFVAQLGVIALGGMIMRNSVILIDQIEQDRSAGVDPWTATVEATVRRLRPIVLTAAAAVLAMIPLTRSVFWGPMAVAIMGGLIVATVLTLVSLPAAYAAWFRVKRVGTPADISSAWGDAVPGKAN